MSTMQEHLSILSKALDLRAYRHQVLASNIANADTPNYKARDFDFKTAMQNAIGGEVGNSNLALAMTAKRHIGNGNGSGEPALQYRGEIQSAVDGNTVDMDAERAQIADNALQYEVLSTLIGNRLQAMRAAITSNQG